MKSLLLILMLFGCSTKATTYYFAASGNDANAGTSAAAPWKTISKFNSVFASKLPGDQFLFNRSDTFYGKLVISRSGSSGLPITIGAYGTGANPVITGFTNISAWTNLGSNIWESTGAVSTLRTCNMVVINGVNTPMGRYPNTGYVTYQSAVTNTSITSTSLNSLATNWTGAEAVIRKNNFITDRDLITSASGGTINYASSNTYNGTANYGFFIQNDARTLDIQNEWYYNPTTFKIRIYSTTSPANVQVSTIDTLINTKQHDYITFDGISVTGSNKDAFTIAGSINVTIQNCSIDFSGKDAIWGAQNWGKSCVNFILQNSTINHTNNNVLTLESEFKGALVSHNTITNTGLYVGMGEKGTSNYGTLTGVEVFANNAIIEYNRIDRTGFNGINFQHSGVLVRSNFVTNSCLQKIDGAGIYTDVGNRTHPYTGQKIYNNIVLNGIGNNAGTTQTGNPIVHGIYADDGCSGMEIYGNTVAFNSYAGIYLHNDSAMNVHDNTSYGNGFGFLLGSYGYQASGFIIKNNIFFAKLVTQKAASFESGINTVTGWGVIDSNYYARPIDNNSMIQTIIHNYSITTQRNLTECQTYSGYDKHSIKIELRIRDLKDIRLEYNETTANKMIALNAKYLDVKKNLYNGSIILTPYTSVVLIRVVQ